MTYEFKAKDNLNDAIRDKVDENLSDFENKHLILTRQINEALSQLPIKGEEGRRNIQGLEVLYNLNHRNWTNAIKDINLGECIDKQSIRKASAKQY